MLPNHIQNIKNKQDTRVFVAMSGGVDSSTAAHLLKQAGFDVVGCFMTVWQPPFLDCSLEAERQDAMRVAAEIGIPFKTVDLADAYKDRVVDYMISEYEAGRTPNPDVMCNGEVKFGAFYEWAKNQGADYVATGHYAQTKTDNSGVTTLVSGSDSHKDQTYFLWQIPVVRLENVLFPIGHLQKGRVRDIAAEAGLPVADKEDSQGLCFLGQIDMQTFLSEFIETYPGSVLNESGNVIGEHEGAQLYTIGQRHGFSVSVKTPSSGPFYVIEKDVEDNTITVSEDNSKTGPVYNGKRVELAGTNWLKDITEYTDQKVSARIRYNQPLQQCRVEVEDGEVAVVFPELLRAVASGQSCVVYDGKQCLGGGVIDVVASKNPS